MPVDAQSLKKVLELEAGKGYQDRAVIGGLANFLRKWALQAIDASTTPGQRKILEKLSSTASVYPSLSKDQRPEYISVVLDILAALEKVNSRPRRAPAPPEPDAPPSPTSTRSTSTKVIRASPSKHVAAGLEAPVTAIKGISTSLEARFRRLGIRSVRDLLYFFPRRHLDFSQRKPISALAEGKEETIVASVWESRVVNMGKRRSTEAIVGDETGNIRAVWFNNPYVARSMKTGNRVILSGRVALFRGQHVFESPQWEIDEGESLHTGRLVPMYHLTQGLTPRNTRKLIKIALDEWSETVVDFVPSAARERQHLLGLPEAIRQAHFPDDLVSKDRARIRLAFDELLLLQVGVLSKKRAWQESGPGSALILESAGKEPLNRFISCLPFRLTPAQEKALREVLSDLAKPKPMSRLLQGDVGSGKTVVAAAAMIASDANGYQSAFMAPTEILAEQHFATIKGLLGNCGNCVEEQEWVCSYSGLMEKPVTLALLTGETGAAAKRDIRNRIADGSIDIVAGTHAIIQKGIEFKRLGMAIVDEQHRFGVGQRSALRKKGANPHILVMTATPIPRTLALTLYGDLDVSVIDRLPAGRQAIKTKWLKPEQRDAAYAFIKREVQKGHQAFILCPLVEESEAIQAKAAVAEYERLVAEVFAQLRVGLIHGRMSAKDKDGVMHAFRAGNLDILVATPVIEVGIDVPNATVMLIESADRFGLSQLHQFRGRVGRGADQSYCMLLAENASEVGSERLDIIEHVYDGFKLAEEDLKLRGPGEFFGTRQSGLPDLRMARLSDLAILEAARAEATAIFSEDPGLKFQGHKPLARELARVWPESTEWS